jgi:hypothetical protein
MSNLNLIWTANFKDGSSIKQYDEAQNEHLFKEVQNRFSELTSFSLSHINNPFIVTVDLKSGTIQINKNQKMEPELINTGDNIRLIFFRRHKHVMNGNLNKELSHIILYFIGYQYNDIDGNNRKILLQIDQEGNIILGGN